MRVETVPLNVDALKVNGRSASYTAYVADARRPRPWVVVCPGGGFQMLAPTEAEPVALFFLSHGYQAFVLEYTTGILPAGALPQATAELAAAVADIRRNAGRYGIDPARCAVAGFSAGGSVASSLATRWHEPYLAEQAVADAEEMRPQAAVLSYPVLDYAYQVERASSDPRAAEPSSLAPEHSRAEMVRMSIAMSLGRHADAERIAHESPMAHVSDKTPPVFLWGTADDDVVWSGQFLSFAARLTDAGVPCELHMYESGEHALSLANEVVLPASKRRRLASVATWTGHALAFLDRHLGR